MSGLAKSPEPESPVLKSASRLLPEVWRHELDDHAMDLRWSAGG